MFQAVAMCSWPCSVILCSHAFAFSTCCAGSEQGLVMYTCCLVNPKGESFVFCAHAVVVRLAPWATRHLLLECPVMQAVQQRLRIYLL